MPEIKHWKWPHNSGKFTKDVDDEGVMVENGLRVIPRTVAS